MSWPKLSETLAFERSPEVCSGCGARWVELTAYFECDEDDKPTPVVLMFCERCERGVMKPHPRAYQEFDENRHWPGALELCTLCRHRDGLSCQRAKLNGGPGVGIAPSPRQIHFKAQRKSQSGWVTIWPPARSCTERQVLALVVAQEEE